jgi:hypothetical protein
MKLLLLYVILLFLAACHPPDATNEMARLLSDVRKTESMYGNFFYPDGTLQYCDSILKTPFGYLSERDLNYAKAMALLQMGNEPGAIKTLEYQLGKTAPNDKEQQTKLLKELAMAYMRLGERTNCLHHHTAQSCIFPISYAGMHLNKTGSQKAIEIYQLLVKQSRNDLESRWLLNIASMTTGGYPQNLPPSLLIPNLGADSSYDIKPFKDVAMNMGLNVNNMGGGTIIDDFDNDGFLDLVTSGWGLQDTMHFFHNNGDGSFSNTSTASGLSKLTGGLHMMQTDYNNDGWKDIFVLRGAWKGEYGKEPNSLLRNNGDGSFTDVTKEAGLLSFHPTQAASWNDYNNDGWLDVFIGNETANEETPHKCELYINNKNGTFTEQAEKAGCAISAFVKGVTSGDIDNDGKPDLFLSTMNGKEILLQNISTPKGIQFKDISATAGLNDTEIRSFPTWFWDYDNDGWLDLLICGYDYRESLAYYAAAEALNKPLSNSGKVFLYHNKGNGQFENVSQQTGVNKIAFAMGSNFGDIDNDGFLDFYLGTGNIRYQSLLPNKLFKNRNGQRFDDITTSARVGNIQKGHGTAFADLDNDGDQDIYIDMGGAFPGDAYESSFYLNPGQNKNNWIKLQLEGVSTNKAAIGARIKVSFTEKGRQRSVYRDVNSGGSFGTNPLMQHIGIGSAAKVDEVAITWPATHQTQVFKNLQPGTLVQIKEGSNSIKSTRQPVLDFMNMKNGAVSCKP